MRKLNSRRENILMKSPQSTTQYKVLGINSSANHLDQKRMCTWMSESTCLKK